MKVTSLKARKGVQEEDCVSEVRIGFDIKGYKGGLKVFIAFESIKVREAFGD